jgi:predicted GH43/DUF377 family glycosyl hydrolase
MYFGSNDGSEILRLKVSDFTNISDPTVLPGQPNQFFGITYNQIGTTDKYLFTGYELPIMVANSSGGVTFKLDASAVPLRGSDARVVYFNKERYLIMTTAARRGSDQCVFYVYDITKGDNIVDALKTFEASNKKPLFKYSLQGPTNAAPISHTGWYVRKDSEGNDQALILYTSGVEAGFAVIEVPRKKRDEQ